VNITLYIIERQVGRLLTKIAQDYDSNNR
jgi:hypothetical protein